MTSYKFKAKIWLYPGTAAWHFMTVPKNKSQEISKRFEDLKAGFGSLKVTATIGKTSWDTSIFPDKKVRSYLLPIKASVRKQEKLSAGNSVTISLKIKV